jgi:thiamine-phosphate pyrophosphorylase
VVDAGKASQTTTCQIYAVIEAGESAPERLAAALAQGVASVLVVAAAGRTLDAAAGRPLIEAAQCVEIAALVDTDVHLARALRADGVHIRAAKDLQGAYAEARERLGQRAIVGVDPAISRHDAMAAAEAGADYMAFGAPPHLSDRDKARSRRDELIAWWAEIFQVPCVAFDVESPREAEALSAAGADFVAVRLVAGTTPASVRDLLAEIAAAIRQPQTAG